MKYSFKTEKLKTTALPIHGKAAIWSNTLVYIKPNQLQAACQASCKKAGLHIKVATTIHPINLTVGRRVERLQQYLLSRLEMFNW